ncbi:MAG: hypothetical protein NVS4B11_17670 [Ktedonobacteraceae bacterium]
MLVAYGPDGRAVNAEETLLVQLQQWSRERVLHCPNCRSIVHVRGGPDKQMQLHFAHQRGECAWSTEAESVRHAQGKIVLSQWLQKQFPSAEVRLEERLPEPNRIADIFVAHADGRRWAVEFQCAPLDIEEWTHRHTAYRKAGIIDIWVIGVNRREKQEAFIEAVIATAREVLFLDPQITPPHVWLRWPVTRTIAQEWQADTAQRPSLEGWVGRHGYGATLHGPLHAIHVSEQGYFVHPIRTTLDHQAQLRHALYASSTLDEALLIAYLRQRVSAEAVQNVIVPLLRAYVRDPDLLRRYNYGRGLLNQALSEDDMTRVHKAKLWLKTLSGQGFTSTQLQALGKEIPFVGPYAPVAKYIEMLANLPLADFAEE